MRKINILFFQCFFLVIPMLGVAQTNKFVIEFNEKGQIIYNLPQLLKTKSQLRFIVKTGQADQSANVQAVYNRFLETILNLEKKDPTNAYYLVLLQAGIQNDENAKKHLQAVQSNFATQLLAILGNSVYRKMIQQKHDLAKEEKNLKTYVLKDQPKLNLPVIENMLGTRYFINNQFLGGESPNANNPALCNQIIELNKGGDCCSTAYISDKNDKVKFKEYHARNFFKDSVELRIHNNVYSELTKQLAVFTKDNTFMSKFDYAGANDQFKKAIDALKTSTQNQNLFDYMDKRYKGTDDATLKGLLTPVFVNGTADAMMDNIDAAAVGLPAELGIAGNRNFLLDLCWVTRGKSLTANPLQDIKPVSFKEKLTTANQVLADSTQSLADVNQRLTNAENMSKTNNAGLALDDIMRMEARLQTLRKTITASIATQKKDIETIKRDQSKADQSVQDSKEMILSDSLLYAGSWTVNPRQGGFFFSPNHVNYHYMRHHNALQNLNNFDVKTKNDINEKQHFDVFLDNATSNSRFVVKTTFADVPKDIDFVGVGFTGAPGGGHRGNYTVDDLYNEYSTYLGLFDPFQNGVITNTIDEIKDKTANYITVTQPISEPSKSPQIGTYSIQDTANKKSTAVAFSYRYNKLYRFRLKAGVAYSWLSRRSYTINSTNNTSTYTDSFAGLAPSFGVQIFTSSLDIQSPRLLPTGAYPFLYVGYMFNDAPINNFLLGGGFEIFSGFAVTGGVHFGKSQGLTVQQGILQEKDFYKAAPFISLTLGIEAFNALFTSAKPSNPFTK